MNSTAADMTVSEYLSWWLALREDDLAANTHARYRTLARNQVVPFVGAVLLRDLTPARIELLYDALSINGGADGSPLLSSTIGQVHRLLHVCLERATDDGLLAANPADRVRSPKIARRYSGPSLTLSLARF